MARSLAPLPRTFVLKPLAEILIDENLCSSETVERAAQVSDRKATPLVAVLVREFGVDEVGLVAAIRRHVRIRSVDPGAASADPDAVRIISRDVCRRLRVMPLSLASYGAKQRLLRLAMADPTDAVALAEVEHHTGCQVEPELMVLSAVEEMVEKSYGAFVTEVMKRGSGDGDPGDDDIPTGAVPGLAGSGAPHSTVPFHRLTDEADVALRLEAVVSLLFARGILREEEVEEKVRELMKGRAEEG
jgi:hypothetical protein